MPTMAAVIARSSWSKVPRRCSDCTGSWRAITPPRMRVWSSRSSCPESRRNSSWTDPRSRDHHLVSSTNYQKAFEDRQADIYRACEWGDPAHLRQSVKGPIVARRPAMVYQAIFVRADSPINATIALADKTVGVQFHQGSHYCDAGDDRRLHAAGGNQGGALRHRQERYEALMSGETDAATLMEPG